MGKLRVLSGQEVCRILAQYGFVEVRQRGSHIIMQKRTDETTITVRCPELFGTTYWDTIYYSPVWIATLSF